MDPYFRIGHISSMGFGDGLKIGHTTVPTVQGLSVIIIMLSSQKAFQKGCTESVFISNSDLGLSKTLRASYSKDALFYCLE